jgi:DNA-binding CsgD family transcriptional regulator
VSAVAGSGSEVAVSPVFGREAEVAAVSAFVEGAAAGRSALVLDGSAGAGKTTLWLAGVRLARARGLRVLEARPVEAEARMAFAALGDLLYDVLDEALDRLAAPQAEALRVALLRQPPRGAPPDERAVGLGLLNALRVLAERGPVLVALDDMQWLDAASAIVLGFAWRRLRDEPVRLLATSRSGAPARETLTRDAERIAVGPLSLGATHRLLHARLDLVLARPALRRVHEAAGGNPFFALELGRALRARSALPAAGEPLPVPDGLRQLVRDRLGALPPATREAITVAAAVVRPTRALVAGVTGDEAVLQPAFGAGVVVVDGDLIRFTHPLLASAAYEDVSPDARRSLHGRLAELVTDVEQRSRHLALAAPGPDEPVANELERAALHARARGSTATAAELMEQASRLTPEARVQERRRRTLAAGRLSFAAGDTVRARRLLDDAVASASGGRDRAEALTALGRLLLYEGDQPSAAAVCAEALEEPAADTGVRASAGGMLGSALLFMREDLDGAARHADEAARLSRDTTDRELRANTVSMSALLQVVTGRPEASETMDEAERLGAPDAEPVIASPSFHRAVMLLWTDGAREAAPLFDDLRARALACGDEASLPLILTEAAIAAYLTGDWPAAGRLTDDAHELALQTGQRSQEAFALGVGALVGAGQGRAERTRELAGAALALAGDRTMAVATIHAEWALAVLELSLGRPEGVADRLGALRRRQLAAGAREPGVVPFLADEAEALISLGRTADAEAVVAWLDDRGRALDRASAVGAAARGTALLAAADGDLPRATDACEDALAAFGRASMPFEEARTLLLLGTLQRRAKRRSAARETLGRALAAFERLGARVWASRAREELARIGGRGPTAAGVLTPSERRVADLVAEGCSNKEIAGKLFVTPKTVETQLSRIYGKLGVHSRIALVRRLGNQ